MKNILSVYGQATEGEVFAGLSWYPDARQKAEEIAMSQGVHEHIAVGVVAALSPNNKWSRNLEDARNLISGYQRGVDVSVCTYHKMKEKAIRILDEQPDAEGVLDILNGKKIKSFYNCILGREDVCVDGHAYNIYLGKRNRLTSGKTSLNKSTYQRVSKAYIRSAKKVGLKPSELQAITWVTWRRLYNIK